MEYRYKFTPKQQEAYIIASNSNITLYGGAIRGGKSYFLILFAFVLAFKFPKSRWLFLRQNLPTLKRTLLVSFNEVLNSGLQQYIKSFNQSDLTVTLTNGSQFIFMAESYDTDKELNRFRGLEINGAFIDEANEIQEVTFNKVIERAGSWFHSPGCPTKIVMTANPTNNWLKDLIYTPYVKGTLQSGFAYVPARIFDNPYIPADYLESLKMLPRYEYEVFVEGSWDIQLKTGSEFLKGFELNKHVRPLSLDITKLIHVSIDNNTFPYIAVTLWQLEKLDNKWLIKQVHELPCKDPNNTAKRAAEVLVKYLQSKGYNQKLFIYGDRSTKNRNTISDDKLSFAEIFMKTLNDNNYKTVDKFLSHAPSVNNIADFVNAIFDQDLKFAEIQINESCKTSINDYIETKQDRDGTMLKKRITDPKTGISYEPNGHLTDTLKDFITSAFYDEFMKFKNRFTLKIGGINNVSRTEKYTL